MAKKTIKICGKSFASVQKIRVTLNDGSGTVDYVETSDADAVSANIANGKKAYVNGALVTGTHVCATLADMTAAGTATAGQILSGKIAYVKGSKITGTMVNRAGGTDAANTVEYDSTNSLVKVTMPKTGYYSTTSKITLTKAQIAALDGIGLTDPDSITTRYARGFVTEGRHAVLPFTPTGVIGFITETSRMTSWIYYVIVDDYCYETWQDGSSSNGFYPYLNSKSSIDNKNKVYNMSRDGTLWYSAGII